MRPVASRAMPYSPATDADVRAMLATIGVDSVDELFSEIPEELRYTGELQIPLGIGELELDAELAQLAARNRGTRSQLSFLGFGCYDHYIPAVCQSLTSRSEFSTAYTPYQAEVSQGTLQAIFEFQTAISELTGLPVANASVYDGASAAAEAMSLAASFTGRSQVIVSGTVLPSVIRVLEAWGRTLSLSVISIPPIAAGSDGGGRADIAAIQNALGDDTAALIIQQPNVFGLLEDAPRLCELASAAGAVPIVSADPLSLGVLEAPGQYGAGLVVGEGQPLGNAMSFGGPGFGYMAAEQRFLRRMPGRMVSETVDRAGRRAWVLALQTREQHIRRERATSNICTNQALCALAGVIHLSWLGPVGLMKLGQLLFERTALLRNSLEAVPGIEAMFDGPGFREVAVRCGQPATVVRERARAHGIDPGIPLATVMPGMPDDALLLATTERHTPGDVERLASVLSEVIA